MLVAVSVVLARSRRAAVALHPGKSYSYARLARSALILLGLPFAAYEVCTFAGDLAGGTLDAPDLTMAMPSSGLAVLASYAGSSFFIATAVVAGAAARWILTGGGDRALADHPGWLPRVEITTPTLYRRCAVLVLAALPFAALLVAYNGPRWELTAFDPTLVHYPSAAAANYVTVFDIREEGWRNWWLAIGAVGLAALVIRESRHAGLISYLFSRNNRRIGRFTVASTAFVIGFAFVAVTLPNYLRMRLSAGSGEYSTVEGVVRRFHAQGEMGHDEESWCVERICVAYSYPTLHNRFSRVAERGGPVRKGLRVRIELAGGDIIKLEVVPPEGGIPTGTRKPS